MNKAESEKNLASEKSSGSRLEKRDGGNLVVVVGNAEDLARIASSVCKKLDPGITYDMAESLKNGEELRPQGVYAIWVDKRKGEARIQNRNARGDKDFNEKMLRATEKSL